MQKKKKKNYILKYALNIFLVVSALLLHITIAEASCQPPAFNYDEWLSYNNDRIINGSGSLSFSGSNFTAGFRLTQVRYWSNICTPVFHPDGSTTYDCVGCTSPSYVEPFFPLYPDGNPGLRLYPVGTNVVANPNAFVHSYWPETITATNTTTHVVTMSQTYSIPSSDRNAYDVWIMGEYFNRTSLGNETVSDMMFIGTIPARNVAPTCSILNLPPNADINTVVSFDVTIADNNGDSVEAYLYYGDGTNDYFPSVAPGTYTDREHTYTTAGSKTVRLDIDDGYGGTRTCTGTINIIAPDETPPTCGALSSFPVWNLNQVITYTGSTKPPATVTVACSDSGSGCTSPTFSRTVNASGTYTIPITDHEGNSRNCSFDIHYNRISTRQVTFTPHTNGTNNQCMLNVAHTDPDEPAGTASKIQIFTNSQSTYNTSAPGTIWLRAWNDGATTTRSFNYTVNSTSFYNIGNAAYLHGKFEDHADDGQPVEHNTGPTYTNGHYNYAACVIDSVAPTCTIRLNSPSGPIFDPNIVYTTNVRLYSECVDTGSGCVAPTTHDQLFATSGTHTYSHLYRDNWNNQYTCTTTFTITPPNDPPSCALNASPSSGNAPLFTTFTYSATDPDNNIDYVRLFLDYTDNPGSYVPLTAGTNRTYNNTYTTADTYEARLIVADLQGETTTCTKLIYVYNTPPSNTPPSCSLNASPVSGDVPFSTTFTYSATDIDNNIDTVRLYFDYNHNPTYFDTVSAGSNRTYPFTYTNPNTYEARLVVTDLEGATDVCTKTVYAESPTNNNPSCALSASPISGYAPLTTRFTYSATDPDGDINSVRLYFDYLDNVNDYANVNSGTNRTHDHTYTIADLYQGRLIVTDTSGATAECTRTITVDDPSNTLPNCSITVSPTSGDASLPVVYTYTATDAEDPPASLNVTLSYGDSGSTTVSGGSNLTASHTYMNPGNYTPSLTVTDTQGGNRSCNAATVQVNTTSTYTVYPPEMKDTNQIIENPDGSFTVQRHTITEIDDNGIISYHDDYHISGYVTVLQANSCANLAFMHVWPFDPFNQHLSEITYSVSGGQLVPGTTYCANSGARDLSLRRTLPTQQLWFTVPEANHVPVLSAIEFPNSIINSTQSGITPYIGSHDKNRVRVVADDEDGIDDIEGVFMNQSYLSGVNNDSVGFLYTENSFYAYDTSIALGNLVPGDLELIGTNGSINLEYETEYIVYSGFSAQIAKINPADLTYDRIIITYDVKFKNTFAVAPSVKQLKEPSGNISNVTAYVVDIPRASHSLSKNLYVDVLDPDGTITSPNTQTFIKGKQPKTLYWSRISDNLPTSGLVVDGLTVSYQLDYNNPPSCELYLQNGATSSGAGCNTKLGVLYDVEISPGVFERYYMQESPLVGAPIFTIPYSQVVATKQSETAITGEYTWDLATKPDLDEKDVRLLITMKDRIGNFGADLSDESFGIDSLPPEFKGFGKYEYVPGNEKTHGYIYMEWNKSTDTVSGVNRYSIYRGHATGRQVLFPKTKILSFDVNSPLPPGVELSESGKRYIFRDYNAYATLPVSSVSLLHTDGSSSHDEYVWSDNYKVTLNWKAGYQDNELYGYTIHTADTVGWNTPSELLTINNVYDPIRQYAISWEFFDNTAPLNPGDGEIKVREYVNHAGAIDAEQIYASPFLTPGKWYAHLIAINSSGIESDVALAGPFFLGGIRPEVEFNYIQGYDENSDPITYNFTLNTDPNDVNYNLPMVTSNFGSVDLSVDAYSNFDGIDVASDGVEIVNINGRAPYTTMLFNKVSPTSDEFMYSLDDENGSLVLDPILRFNRIRVRVSDELGLSNEFDCIIEYVPEAHIDVKLTGDVSAAFTESQIEYDNDLQEGEDEIQFDATIYSPGVKGLNANYYSDESWNNISSSMIEPDIAHGLFDDGGNHQDGRSYMAYLAEVDSDDNYSVRYEGRMRVPESGEYWFRYDVGAGDTFYMYIDTLDTPYFTNEGDENYTSPSRFETSESIHLQDGVWYGITVKYVARKTSHMTGDDIIRMDWKYIRDGAAFVNEYETVTKENLAFNAGNISKIYNDYSVTISLPEGVRYDDSRKPLVSYMSASGSYMDNLYLLPDSVVPYDTVNNVPYVSEEEPVQTLTWHFDSPTMMTNAPPITEFSTVIPVGKSLKLTFWGKAEIARKISNTNDNN